MKLRWRTVLAYAAPATGFSFYLFFLQFYFLKYATDVLLLSPALIGALFGVGRLWDAVSDPIAGFLSDRTRSRWGRRRPWLFAGVPLLALTFLMVWRPPAALEGAALVAWCGAALFGFFTAYTIYWVPHLSLGAELTDDHHDRSRVFGAQRMAFMFGMLLAFGGIQLVTNAADEREAARSLSWATAFAVSALLLVAPAVLRERREHQGRGASSPLRALRDVLANRHARLLLMVWFIDSLGAGALGVLAPFIGEYVLRRPDLIGVIPAFFFVPSLISIPLWVRLSRRYGKRKVWLAAMYGVACFFGATAFAGAGDLVLLCTLLAGAGAAFGCGGAIGQSIMADVIDYDELETGERKEGAYAAAFGFVLKLAVGFTIVLSGAALELMGFEPNVEQSRSTELALRGIFAGLPFVAFLVGAALFRGFQLDHAEHGRIRAALAQRAAARASGPA